MNFGDFVSFEEFEGIEVRDVKGKCISCGKETGYYDEGLDGYVCCYECGYKFSEELYDFLDSYK